MADDAHEYLPQDFALRRREVNGTLVLALTGDLDIATAPQVVDAFERLPANARRVAIDMRGVTFVDSSGLRGLLVARRRTEAVGAELFIVHDPAVHGEILRLTQLDEELPLVDADGFDELVGEG